MTSALVLTNGSAAKNRNPVPAIKYTFVVSPINEKKAPAKPKPAANIKMYFLLMLNVPMNRLPISMPAALTDRTVPIVWESVMGISIGVNKV